MPRQELLENITPNKYYTIDATLRYMHTTPNYQTAILESNNKQAKIKLLPGTEVELNTEYKFKKCFASSNGWLTEKEAADGGANMETLATNVPPVISRLQDINSQVERYTGIYVSIVLKIVEIEPTKVFLKHGNNLTLDVLKCFGDGFFVNVNLWNKDISSLQVGTWMAFSAFRINLLPNNFYVLFSSVYSNIEPYNGPIQRDETDFSSCISVSSVCQVRSLLQTAQSLTGALKSQSIVTARIHALTYQEYYGCQKCRKKLNQSLKCPKCGETQLVKYDMAKVQLKDEICILQTVVFDNKLLDLFKCTRPNSQVTAKVQSMGKSSTMVSHVISSIVSLVI